MCSPNTSLPPIQCPSRRNGKIAKLPIEQRDTLNHMLADGATSTAIINHFRALKVDLNPTNITNWKEGGFQDWLRHQEALHELHNDGDLAALLGTGTGETAFHKGVLRLAMTKLFKALRTDQLGDDPANYNRLLTNLARLSRESLALRKHLDGISGSGASTAQPPMLDPHRELTDDERTAILDKLDRILGFTLEKTPPVTDSTPKTPELNPIQGDLSQPSFSRSRERQFAPTDREPHAPIELPRAPELTPKDDDIGFIGADAPVTSAEERNYLRSLCAPFDSEQTTAPEVPTNPAPCAPPSETFAICNMPSSIETRTNPDPNFIPAPSEIGGNPPESLAENPAPPEIENRKSAIQNFSHPDLKTCNRCGAELPPLLPNGERPNPFCTCCGTSLRHPATLKFYCPSCRNSVREIWHTDDERTSDTCPHCLATLPPVEPKKTEPPPAQPQPDATETAHAE